MNEFELVRTYQNIERELKALGYSVSAISTGFFVHNNWGTIVADCRTVDGLRGFAQGLEYAGSIDTKP